LAATAYPSYTTHQPQCQCPLSSEPLSFSKPSRLPYLSTSRCHGLVVVRHVDVKRWSGWGNPTKKCLEKRRRRVVIVWGKRYRGRWSSSLTFTPHIRFPNFPPGGGGGRRQRCKVGGEPSVDVLYGGHDHDRSIDREPFRWLLLLYGPPPSIPGGRPYLLSFAFPIRASGAMAYA
jgi:hypothetical protein